MDMINDKSDKMSNGCGAIGMKGTVRVVDMMIAKVDRLRCTRRNNH